MAYQVLARKWRPKRFDEVVGQRGVTQTLSNALASGRLAQAFVFAGPRGVGKTTTARILARALNCANGPTANPCGECEACREISDGRDIDVLEIDAATHTGVDNIREVVIEGLSLPPLRDRRKIFIIDEVHQLSGSSFNALLKSVEEPPPHVVFIMATTALDKIPDTILSRSQVFEFRTIGLSAIVDQLTKIAAAEGITADEAALTLIARAAEGSMRDAQSAFDQVISFAGDRVDVEAVTTVLGLVSRDLLFDIAEAVADERAPAIFDLIATAVERGYDLKQLCQELSKLVRDLMLVNVDKTRIDDPEVAPEGDRERLRALAERFSLEDLLRAFDVLAQAEEEVKRSAQPRYSVEMALLRWVHLRKLLPLAQVLEQIQRSGSPGASGPLDSARGRPAIAAPPRTPATRTSVAPASLPAAPATPAAGSPAAQSPFTAAGGSLASATARAVATRPAAASPPASPAPSGGSGLSGTALKDAFLANISRTKRFIYNTVAGQAQRIEVDGDRIVFTFSPTQRVLHMQLDQYKKDLEVIASDLAGRPIAIAGQFGGAADETPQPGAAAEARKARLTEQAKEDAAVQAMLDVFPAAIRDVEEIDS